MLHVVVFSSGLHKTLVGDQTEHVFLRGTWGRMSALSIYCFVDFAITLEQVFPSEIMVESTTGDLHTDNGHDHVVRATSPD